jgi:3-hydroxybutyryl-CoA dehydrogenase
MTNTIGVVGSGTMGGGIAQVAAQAGCDVILLDTTLERSRGGLSKIASSLKRLADKGKISADDATAITGRITPSADFSALANSPLVIEAVFEDPDTKRGVIEAVSAVTDPSSIFATNTSSISITKLASYHPHPDKVAGMHFFNPVPLMPLVELIRAEQSSPETVEYVREKAESFGKTVVEVADVPGFVANRVLMPMINEAILCLEGGVASAEAIDQTLKLGANHPMGPLALADLIGLDVVLNIIEVLHRDLGEDKYRPAILLKRMVAAGKLGRKSGEGFYVYD